MVAQAKEGRIDLLENHKSSFAIGSTSGAAVEKTDFAHKFAVEFELNTKYPQALELFESVQKKLDKYQLSIGGYVPLDDPDALLFESREDGSIRRVINKIKLDHIAVTRKNHAANDHTGFRHAVMKSLEDIKEATLDLNSLISISEGILKDQGSENTLNMTPAQIKSSAVRLISQYVNLGITPPSGLLQLSKGSFGSWTPERAEEWDKFKESVLNTPKENTMANEEVSKTEVEGFVLSKALSSMKEGLATIDLKDPSVKESLSQFMNELCVFAGLSSEKKEEKSETSVNTEKLSAIDAMLSTIEEGLKLNKAAVESLSTSAKSDLTALAESIKAGFEAAIAKAVEGLKSEIDSKVSELGDRVKKVEELEGEPSFVGKSKDDSSDSESDIWQGVIFKRKP